MSDPYSLEKENIMYIVGFLMGLERYFELKGLENPLVIPLEKLREVMDMLDNRMEEK